MEKSFRVEERIVGEMGPVVGTHAGPGTVGTAIFQPTADELPLIAPLEETA
jgi:fatty acid-binding protein DegV